MSIKAIFTGKDGSCGFKTGKEYHLILVNQNGIVLAKNALNSDRCEYESTIAFLNNWNKIERLYENI